MSKDLKKKRRFIRENYLGKSNEELAARLAMSIDDVKRILKEMGLKREEKVFAGKKVHPQEKVLYASPKTRFLFLALIILMGISIYSNTFKNELVWDDYFLVADNLYIRDVKFLRDIFTTDLHRFGLDRSNFYRPLQTISYMLDYAVGKFETFPYHFTNLFLHLASGVLIYFIALDLSKNEIISFLSSFIFVSHPVQTETVTYISDRADLLAAAFIFGGFFSFLRYCSGRKFSLFLIFNIFFILALLSKEISLIFPFLIFTWAMFYSDKRKEANLKQAYWSVGAIAALYIISRLTILHFRGNVFGLDANEVFIVRFLTMLKVIWRYFVLLVFPLNLHMERNFPWIRNLADPAMWAGLAIIASSCVFAGKAFRKENYASFAVFWFWISLFPILNIIPVNAIMSEHWLYLPSFAFALVAAFVIFRLYQFRSRTFKIVLSLCLAANFSFYAYKAITRNAEWRNEETLYYATLRYQPDSSRVYYNLGNVYVHRAEYPRAVEKYMRAVELQPDYAVAWNNLGLANFRLGKVDAAIGDYHTALKYKSDLASAHNNLGLALDAKWMGEEAKMEYEKAIECDPNYAEPHNGLGIYYAKKEKWQEAIYNFREALRKQPDFQDAANNLKRAEIIRDSD